MSSLRINLFGRFHCEIDQSPVSGLEVRKVQELLGYLALYRTRFHHRDVLATLLWEDRPDLQARKALRQTLWLLQSALNGADAGTHRAFLVVDGDWIGLNPLADIWVDAQVLQTTYDELQLAANTPPGRERFHALHEVVSLGGGDLLEGCLYEWCIRERDRHLAMHLSILDYLLADCEAHGDYQAGVYYGSMILRLDSARENTHRCLMRLHSAMGQRTRALRQYELCVAALERELGVGPAKRTQELYERIRLDQIEAAADEPHNAIAPPSPPPATPISQLETIRQMLRQLQEQVDVLIAALQ
jgi:DNA-binding SARP family transcriptional activator